MWLQAAALALVAVVDSFALWAVAAVVLGAGTALVYPTLLAAIGDVAHPAWRARSVGVYRLWRDAGFAVGALLGGVIADLYGLRAAVAVVAVITAASGLLLAARASARHRGSRVRRVAQDRCRGGRRTSQVDPSSAGVASPTAVPVAPGRRGRGRAT